MSSTAASNPVPRNRGNSSLTNDRPVKQYAKDDFSHLESGFSSLLLLEYLNQDQRATLVVEILELNNQSSPDEVVVFCNNALVELTNLYEEIIQVFSPSRPSQEVEDERRDFKSWIAAAETRIAGSKRKQSHMFYNVLWNTTVMEGRWAVISGVELPTDDSALPNYTLWARKEIFSNDATMHDLSSGRLGPPGDETPDSRASREHKRPRIELSRPWPPPLLPQSDHLTFFSQFDWASTSLGPFETWPHALREACEIMFANPDPVALFWGDDLNMLYNEAYIAIAGNKHPELMGGSSRIHFKEVWDQYEALFQKMRLDGQAFKQENAQLFLHRRGFLEEGYFHLAVIPLLGDDGSVQGFYEPVFEITRQVLSERRMHKLLQLSESFSSVTTLTDVWMLLLKALKEHESDVHFAFLYSLERVRDSWSSLEEYKFEGAVGFRDDNLSSQALLNGGRAEGDQAGFLSAFHSAYQDGSAIVLHTEDQSLSKNLLQTLERCGIEQPCRTVIVCSLASSVDQNSVAFLAIGVNPKRHFDADYRLFVQLLARQVESTITSVQLFEKEKARLAQEAALKSDLRFKRFAERAPVGIFNFDADGKINFCNEAWLELSGHPRDDMSAMSWTKDVHPENADEIKSYWDRISRLEGPLTFEVQYKKAWKPLQGGGDETFLDRTWVLASAYPEVSEDGSLAGITGCITNISHQKWADYLQSQRLSEALELKRQQENFLDITSHEMRNPLNAILHCASELIELLTGQSVGLSPVDEPSRFLAECLEASRTIAYCGRHQKRIIDDVLTLSKLDSDLLGISPLATRPYEIVEEVLKVFDAELRASSIETSTDLADSYQKLHIDDVLIDPHRVIQILINLVANAIKFTKGEALRNLRIVISAFLTEPADQAGGVRYVPSGRHRKIPDPTQKPEWGDGETVFLHFSVQDTGPGMTQEEANLLFNRFVQGSPRTHTKYGGSGLGLFISRELAELHAGRIGISSQVGLGSTFDFYIKGRRALESSAIASARAKEAVAGRAMPQRALARAVKSSPSVLTAAPNSDQLHVLIVEDNIINQRILTKLMRKEGFDVSIANHGQEALTIIQSSRWWRGQELTGTRLDIVLADIEMPVMDGKACARQIREWQREDLLHGNIPIIAVTGNARSEQIMAAKECGFDDVVSKPYQVDDLLRRVYHFANV